MIYRRMKTAIWEDTGIYGLAPGWIANADPSNGLGVAHDVLEHFPREMGDAEGELMATGAFFLIRGETGWLWWNRRRGNSDLVMNMGGAIHDILKCLSQRELFLASPGNTRELDRCYEDVLWQALNAGFEIAAAENKYEEDPAIDALIAQRHRHYPDMLGWMRRGMRGAARRYGGWELSRVAQTFDNLTEAADRLIYTLGMDGEPEGLEVLVWADPRSENAGARVLDPEWAYC